MDHVSPKEIRSLYRIGGAPAALQLAAILGYAVVAAVLGPKPVGAEEYFAVYLESPAAAEAVIASDMWNGSAAYMGGILLQGSGVVISFIMVRSRDFSKVTAWAGVLGNGFDLVQHMLHPFAPSVAGPIQMVMGVFYVVWYPMLARDLFRPARSLPRESRDTPRREACSDTSV